MTTKNRHLRARVSLLLYPSKAVRMALRPPCWVHSLEMRWMVMFPTCAEGLTRTRCRPHSLGCFLAAQPKASEGDETKPQVHI